MKSILTTLLFAAAALAQPPAPDYSDVKTYLNLTDSQITSLTAIRTQSRTALTSVQQQIQAKQTQLNTLLSAGSTDTAAVGKLVIDINTLRTQVDKTLTSFRDQAKNVLTADQKTKLAALDAAAKLQPAIREASALLLLTPPANTQGPIIGGRGPAGFGTFGGGPRGPLDGGFPAPPEN